MIIVSLKSKSSEERIELSDGSLFSFKICYLPPELQITRFYDSGTAEGREISAFEEAAFRHASACLRTERAALRLIARAEQCEQGLARKLQRRGHDGPCVNAVISRLAELNLLDDCRYAQLWLESRLRLVRSPRRLLVSLCARGIAREDAEAALKTALDEDAEFAILSRFAKKHAQKATRRGEDVTRSLRHLLKSEGFSQTAIRRFLEED